MQGGKRATPEMGGKVARVLWNVNLIPSWAQINNALLGFYLARQVQGEVDGG